MLLQQLAVTYADKFFVDSLEMYEALTDLWRVQSNKSSRVTRMNVEPTKVKQISVVALYFRFCWVYIFKVAL